MKAITQATYETALAILIESFASNPNILRIIKKDQHVERRLRSLCMFCLDMAILKRGAYITTDEAGVALVFLSSQRISFIKALPKYIQFINECVGWERCFSVFIDQWFLNLRRPPYTHLFFQMMAVSKKRNGLQTIIEIRDKIFSISNFLGIPIYAETSLEKNKIVYERYGFQLLETIPHAQEGYNIYLLQKNAA